MSRSFFALLFLAYLVSWIDSAQAYPDLIRHNYVNCNSCHVSPTGGGALTPYGRAMSKEVLSTWGTERETAFLNGIVKPEDLPEWLVTGGDVRYLQVHKESPERKTGRGFLMQAELEVGFKTEKYGGVIAIGQAVPRADEIRWISPEFYGLWTPRDELAVRVGRFIPVFGIAVPYHTLPTRQSLGFMPGFERDSIEAVWSGEIWNSGLSVSRHPEGPIRENQRETMWTAQVNRNFAGRFRVGASVLTANADIQNRSALGAHAILGFSERWAYLTEFDVQWVSPANGGSTTGLYHFSQLIYGPVQGLNFYLIEEYQKSDLNDSRTLVDAFGPGIRFFPRPHFELDAVFTKRRTAAVADRYDDYAWVLLHYYF